MKPFVVALTGVSGTGKTTLMEDIEKYFGSDRVESVYEITKAEILGWSYLPVDFELSRATAKQIASYDLGRTDRQLQKERDTIRLTKKEIVVFEKPATVALSYMLMQSARFLPNDTVRMTVKDYIEHAKSQYDTLFFLSWNRVRDSTDSEIVWNRINVNHSALAIQSAAIKAVAEWTGIYAVVNAISNQWVINEIERKYESRNRETETSCTR